MLAVLVVVLLATGWSLWNLTVQTQRFNELLGRCEQTLQQLREDAQPGSDVGEAQQGAEQSV